MLVLSRTEGDGISFPELDLAIQVLKIQGNKVQIGIKAAEEIRILRSELLNRVSQKTLSQDTEARHTLRNRLNAVSLAMSICEKYLERGDTKNAELALGNMAAKLSAAAKPKDVATHASSSKCDTTSSKKRIQVLLVEDNVNEGSLLAEILRLNQVDVQVVQDGLQALIAIGIKKPDVILLDMHMPNCDGKQTLKQIRKDARLEAIPVYAVTGAEKAEMGIEISHKDGVDEWFQKPIQPMSLLNAINSLCQASIAC